MGSIFKKTFTKPVPEGAEVIHRKGVACVQWKDDSGKLRTAKLTSGRDGKPRVLIEAGTYTAKYRDGQGDLVEVSTGCRDAVAARAILADLERRAQLVKSKVISADEDAMADHQNTRLMDHVLTFIDHQTARGLNRDRIKSTRQRINRIAGECGFKTLADLRGDKFENWLMERQKDGMSAGSRNGYREAILGFTNWCVRTNRIITNPLRNAPRADNRADCRRKRRALNEVELTRLLDVARRRPLLDAVTVRRGKRKGETVANLRPEVIEQLERLGWERALIYKTLVLTGLRLNELRTLTIGQLVLDGDFPSLTLIAANEKNRQGNTLPLRTDLANDLANWIKSNGERFYGAAAIASNGHCPLPLTETSAPTGLPTTTPLFDVPHGLLRILNRDLAMAGIPKRDERGRTVDLHAMRHTLGTLLNKYGVSPRTAQAAMRHSSIDLTMNVYTDPKLLDIAGALMRLPAFPLNTEPNTTVATGTADGSNNLGQRSLAPLLAPDSFNLGQTGALPDNSPRRTEKENPRSALDVTSSPDKRKSPLTSSVKGLFRVERKGVEPSTSALRTQETVDATVGLSELTTLGSAACPAACTGDVKTGHEESKPENPGVDLDALASAFLSLSPDDRARLATILIAGIKS